MPVLRGWRKIRLQEQVLRCWTPEALAGKAGEKAIRRAPYDASIEPREATLTFPPLPGNMRGSIRSVKLPHGEKLVALTFDLCENADEISGYDAEIVDTLRRSRRQGDVLSEREMAPRSHGASASSFSPIRFFRLAAHSWTHRNFRLLTEDQVKADLALDLKADAIVRQSLHAKACFRMRPRPSASAMRTTRLYSVFRSAPATPKALKAVNDAGLLAIQWDLRSGDPAKAQSADAIRKGVGGERQARLHHRHARQRPRLAYGRSLARLIEELRKRGFEFATVRSCWQRASQSSPIAATN